MAFKSKVERWRPFAAKYLPAVPADFVLRWIELESDGYTRATGKERGILQIHPGEAEAIGIPADDFDFLYVTEDQPDYDADRHFRISVKLILHKIALANATTKKYSLLWEGKHFLALVKLLHGLPVIVSRGVPAYIEALGWSPDSFPAFSGWLRASGWSVKSGSKTWNAGRVSEILANAERTSGLPVGRFNPAVADAYPTLRAVVVAVATLPWFSRRRA